MIYATEARLTVLVFVLAMDVIAFVAVRHLLRGEVWTWFSAGPTRDEQPIRYWLGTVSHSIFALGAVLFTLLLLGTFLQRPSI